MRLVGRFDLCALQASKVSPGTLPPCSSTPAARQLGRRGAGIGPAGRYKGVVKSEERVVVVSRERLDVCAMCVTCATIGRLMYACASAL